MDAIGQEVIAIIARITKVPADKLLPDTNLKLEFNVDSLQGLQIIAALEKRLGIIVPDEELDSYTTVRTIVETVKRLQPLA